MVDFFFLFFDAAQRLRRPLEGPTQFLVDAELGTP
jgi:hypothetical protein